MQYDGPSSVNPQKRVNFDSKMREYFEWIIGTPS